MPPPRPPRPDLPDDGSRREEDALAGPHPHVVTVEEVRSIDPDTGEVQDKPLLETVRVTQRGAQDTQNQQVDAGSVRLTSAGGNVQADLDLEPGVPSPDVETPQGQRILNTVDLRTGEVVETGIPESGPAQQAPADPNAAYTNATDVTQAYEQMAQEGYDSSAPGYQAELERRSQANAEARAQDGDSNPLTAVPESGPAQQAPADLDTPADSLDPLSGDPAPLSKKERVRQTLLAGRRDAGIIGQGLGRGAANVGQGLGTGAANVRLGAAGAVGYAATQLEAQKERNLQAAANERRRLREEKQNAAQLHAEILELQKAQKTEQRRQKGLGTSGRLSEKGRRVQAALGGQKQAPSEQSRLGAAIKAKQKETEKAAKNYRPAKGAKGTPKNPYQAALEALAKMGAGKESGRAAPPRRGKGSGKKSPGRPRKDGQQTITLVITPQGQVQAQQQTPPARRGRTRTAGIF